MWPGGTVCNFERLPDGCLEGYRRGPCVPTTRYGKVTGAEVINFEQENPIEAILILTGGIGVDRVIDAVHAEKGPTAQKAEQRKEQFQQELKKVAPKTSLQGASWASGDTLSQSVQWAGKEAAKTDTFSYNGWYLETMEFFPLGQATFKNLTINGGNCPHRKYIPLLFEMVKSWTVDPEKVFLNIEPLTSVINAYKSFDERQPG